LGVDADSEEREGGKGSEIEHGHSNDLYLLFSMLDAVYQD
jgi:hypothetical protein